MKKTNHEKSLSFAEIKPVKEYAPSFNYRHFLEVYYYLKFKVKLANNQSVCNTV